MAPTVITYGSLAGERILLGEMALAAHWNVTRTLLAQALHRVLNHALAIERDFKTLQDMLEAIGTQATGSTGSY
jgi:hypothetical protein